MQVAFVLKCQGYGILRVDSLLLAIYYGSFAYALPKSVTGFSGVGRREAIYAERHSEDIEPLGVGLLAYVEIVGRRVYRRILTANLYRREQSFSWGEEFFRGAASK